MKELENVELTDGTDEISFSSSALNKTLDWICAMTSGFSCFIA